MSFGLISALAFNTYAGAITGIVKLSGNIPTPKWWTTLIRRSRIQKEAFRIQDVPAGTYKLQVWHEAMGTQTKEVTVKGEEEVRVVFELTPKK